MKTALLSLAMVAAAAVPGAASAATVSVDDSGTIEYLAAKGEANRVNLASAFGPFTFVDDGARLTAGDGCTALEAGVSCPGGPIDVALGDGNDRARVNSFYRVADVTVDGGSGADDVLVGSNDEATATGGAGDDTLVFFAGNVGIGDGGNGNDQLAGHSTFDQLQGGAGNDLLVKQPGTGRQVGTLSGGAGNDRIVATGSSATSDGGDGNDVLVNGRTITGAGGNDLISSTNGAAAIDGGAGNDVIVALADGTQPDTIACGPGWDLVWADATDTVGDDCETRFDDGPAPTLPGQTRAQADATALLAHKPDVG